MVQNTQQFLVYGKRIAFIEKHGRGRGSIRVDFV
jgi:hypothetical protein